MSSAENPPSGSTFKAVISNADKIQVSPGRAMKTLAAGNHHIKIRKRLFQGNGLANIAAGIGAAPVQQAIRILVSRSKASGFTERTLVSPSSAMSLSRYSSVS